MASEHTLTFTDGAFDQDVLNSEVPVLVDFWAPWCGPCKAMGPTVDALATEYAGKVKIGKINTDENPATAMRYQVRGIPTLLLFKGGKVVEQRVGAMPKPELLKMIEPHVGAAVAAPKPEAVAPKVEA
jgi:thioredoxin 1